MVGGIVIEVIILPDKVYVDCRDARYRDTCAIHVVRNQDSETIEFGDRLWWQERWAYWTPADKNRVDVKIPRVGYSGVLHPSLKRIVDRWYPDQQTASRNRS
jgi:hypothetical protein